MNKFQEEILGKSSKGELPEQLAEDYTLEQLAQCEELIKAGYLDGESVEDEQGRVISIIHPAITLRGREHIESLVPLTGGKRTSLFLQGVKNHPLVVVFLFLFALVLGIGSLCGALDTTWQFIGKVFNRQQPTAIAEPNPLRYAHHQVTKESNDYVVIIYFDRPRNDDSWGRCSFEAKLAPETTGRILEFAGHGPGSFFSSVITNDGRTATARYTPMQDACVSLKVSSLGKIGISGNHGLKDFQIEVKDGATWGELLEPKASVSF